VSTPRTKPDECLPTLIRALRCHRFVHADTGPVPLSVSFRARARPDRSGHVVRGVVEVNDVKLKKTVRVPAGKSYLAKG
jgi:hypothetical protein